MRRAYRDRAIYLGDPDFVKVPLAQLSSVDYAAGQRSSIRTDKAMPSSLLPGIESEPMGMQTTHFSVLGFAGQSRRGHDFGEFVLRHGLHAAEDGSAAQQHHG